VGWCVGPLILARGRGGGGGGGGDLVEGRSLGENYAPSSGV